ncbi:50S ribosomal protein L18 [Candidatus Uhrbacteria bacterium RIFCSPHIGHO2_02_FULL_60_10]|uniref:Large ribosomal subunit protein uL18 n=1 Tax=Candidatus Uhrbacteria bacterium RIFCSPHIGHO2_02_FULL_60_10 TaxID=1802392 RepID=A0A1F7U469_9BACT|nr:MAG: 50S ribosomal protein L18 [Candidatus Uhrbacteria bacterium RIFCSPHIGHO2_02_FULL_60_10]
MKDINAKKREARLRRQRRVRATVRGTAAKPRLSAYRSLGHIYAQLIDDESGKTLAAASDLKLSKKETKVEGKTGKVAVAFAVGQKVAAEAVKKGVSTVVFDRNGFAYTGRVAALADGARAGGLKF